MIVSHLVNQVVGQGHGLTAGNSPVPGPSLSRIGRAMLLAGGLAAALLASSGAAASGPNPAGVAAPLVGEVSLIIGSARVVHQDGSFEALRRGSRIAVGDRVETSGNGHVHVRFIDNAAVSVRPDSVLEVQAYRYDAGNPQVNEVRLNVEQGMSRSISGHATEFDKNRFRLNTPLAAIGVRGTDFLVQTTQNGVRASVADGAIVVAALGATCSAEGLGPCSGVQTKVLSADMGRMMAEVRRGDDVARLVPMAGTLVAAGGAGAEEKLAAQRASESAARSAGMLAAEPFRSNVNDRAAADLLTIAEAAVPDLNSKPDSKAQLVWGRYSPVHPFNDNVSVPYSLARLGRDVAIGDYDYTLFRAKDPNSPDGMLNSVEKSVDFRLSRGQATFEIGGAVEAAVINGGTLTVDFTRRTFATALALSSASAGGAELRVAGGVLADGTFGATDPGAVRQYVAGALSLDGKEAGYLFERGAAGGVFKGKTLWGR